MVSSLSQCSDEFVRLNSLLLSRQTLRIADRSLGGYFPDGEWNLVFAFLKKWVGEHSHLFFRADVLLPPRFRSREEEMVFILCGKWSLRRLGVPELFLRSFDSSFADAFVSLLFGHSPQGLVALCFGLSDSWLCRDRCDFPPDTGRYRELGPFQPKDGQCFPFQ